MKAMSSERITRAKASQTATQDNIIIISSDGPTIQDNGPRAPSVELGSAVLLRIHSPHVLKPGSQLLLSPDKTENRSMEAF